MSHIGNLEADTKSRGPITLLPQLHGDREFHSRVQPKHCCGSKRVWVYSADIRPERTAVREDGWPSKRPKIATCGSSDNRARSHNLLMKLVEGPIGPLVYSPKMRWGLVLAAMTCVSATASASDSPLELMWQAPAECPSEADVHADVEKRLGGSASGKHVLARARVTHREDSSWQVVLSTTQAGTSGERTLDGPTCVAVARATALILALTIDPEALSRRPTPPPLPPPPTPIPTPPPIAVSPAPHHGLAATSQLQLSLRASYAVGFGVARDVVSPLGLGVAFGARAGRFTVELVAYSFRESDDLTPLVGGTFWLLAVGGSGCSAVLDTKRIQVGGCAGMEIQRMQGDGFGVSQTRTGWASWAAPTASLFFDLKLTSLVWLATRFDGALPLSHPRFVLENVGPVFQVGAASGRASVGIELRF